MNKPFRPLLAATYTEDLDLEFPLLGSGKLDGQRVCVLNGQAVSRSLKPIQNKALREVLSNPLLDGLDGEVLAGDPNSDRAFNNTIRKVSAHNASIDGLVLFCFDDFSDPSLPFFQRLELARSKVEKARREGLPVDFLHHEEVTSTAQMLTMYRRNLDKGLEGLMLRKVDAPYRYGRSTPRSGELFKLKEFATAEAVVTGWEPLYRNFNEKTTNALGLSERSSHKGNKVADELVGALYARDLITGVEFKVGSGFTLEDREQMYLERETLCGRIFTYKSAQAGVIELPRHPVWLGFRSEEDLA